MGYNRGGGGDANIERRLVKELLRTESKRGYVQIAMVDWVGEKTYRQLEKREFFNGDDGSIKTGKAKGFNKADFALILGRAREIATLFGLDSAPASNVAPSSNTGVSDPAPETGGRPDPF